MSRARNIKPSFFMNEDLGEVPFEARLFFIGIWCLCDPEGKMEFRPKRVKAELFPYDDVDCTRLAQCLHGAGLIKVYEVGGEAYIWVPTFTKHQTPHMKEKARGYPDYSDGFKAAPDKPGADPMPAHLNPEPGYLKPDVLNVDIATVVATPATENPKPKAKTNANARTSLVQFLTDTDGLPPTTWAAYPRNEFGWPAERLNTVWRCFQRYWTSPDCPKPLKRDWKGTWENWCDREAKDGRRGGGVGGSSGGNLAAALGSYVARGSRDGDPHRTPGVPGGAEADSRDGSGDCGSSEIPF